MPAQLIVHDVRDLAELRGSKVAQRARGYEKVRFYEDPNSGLEAVIAVHSTALGQSLGGARIKPYDTRELMVNDALRLAEGMSLKYSLAGLHRGGGKAVIRADPKKVTKEMLLSFGECVNNMGGDYVTAEDIGSTTKDMAVVATVTPYVGGLDGKSGDPSPVTALGVHHGMKACAEYKWGSGDLQGKRVLVQGVGKVGSRLVDLLVKDGADVTICDRDKEDAQERVRAVQALYGADKVPAVHETEAYTTATDIFAPCGEGGILNVQTIPQLTCSIVAGAANNQLLEDLDAQRLADRGIIYAPDFGINAGGILSVETERNGLGTPWAYEQAAAIHDRIASILKMAESSGKTTHDIAVDLAWQRIRAAETQRAAARPTPA